MVPCCGFLIFQPIKHHLKIIDIEIFCQNYTCTGGSNIKFNVLSQNIGEVFLKVIEGTSEKNTFKLFHM